MKNVKYLFVTIALGLVLTSCGDSFLTQNPEGGMLTEEQFKSLPDNLTGSIMGIYSSLYAASDHDEFGQRSIDMYGDIQSGDMAKPLDGYGWFSVYDRGYFYAYASSYIWSFYYSIINLTNICANAVSDNVQEMRDRIITDDPTDAIVEQAYYYGQVLAIRGWCYANLLNYYCDPMDEITDLTTELAVPVYTESEIKQADLMGAPRSTVAAVYNRVYEDLMDAIELLDYYGPKYDNRSSKLEVDADVARLMLAYAMLNHGYKDEDFVTGKSAYDIAFEQAKAVIDGGKYKLLPKAELTTTGFGNVKSTDWMWGQDVTVESTTKLASFFGQCDIYTYSYAAAGDTKCIDEALYKEITAKKWDARKEWFKAKDPMIYTPYRKFYNLATGNLNPSSPSYMDNVDRNWLNDNVFMRVELAYLIAAEAAWADNDAATDPLDYLKPLCDERVIDGKDTDYSNWINSLTTDDAIKAALIYNWRVEMWGEGYGLQTLRRLSKQNTLGSNHLDTRANKTIKADYQCRCQIPSSETRYNPYISNEELQQDND